MAPPFMRYGIRNGVDDNRDTLSVLRDPDQGVLFVAVLNRSFAYHIAGIGNVVQGFFSQPLNAKEFFTAGSSMNA